MGLFQSNFFGEWMAKTTVQTHLSNVIFVDIFAFLPNDDIVLNVVFVSQRFSEICLPILRKRFDGATSSWVRRFDNPYEVVYPSNVHENWRNNNVALYLADIDNRSSRPSIFGKVYARKFFAHSKPLQKNHQVIIIYKCLYDLVHGETQIEAKHNRCSAEGFCIYDFDGTVPINSNRNSQLHLQIQYIVKGRPTYIDDNSGHFYIFSSNSNMGRAWIILADFKAFFGFCFLFPFRICWNISAYALRKFIHYVQHI